METPIVNQPSDGLNAVPTADVDRPIAHARVLRVNGARAALETDFLAIEEPLQIRMAWTDDGRKRQRNIAVTMRTPGHDFELALGFLFSEGLVHTKEDVTALYHAGPMQQNLYHNTVRAVLRPGLKVDMPRLRRYGLTSSSCGVCGKVSVEHLAQACPRALDSGVQFSPEFISSLPDRLRERQSVFTQTGGLHAAALFDAHGNLLVVREDVGRHNAMDKLVGWRLMQDTLPAGDAVVMFSGRTSFELLQKAALATIPVVASVGAPSSLAVQTAEMFNITLLGFVRGHRFNVYSGGQRIRIGAENH